MVSIRQSPNLDETLHTHVHIWENKVALEFISLSNPKTHAVYNKSSNNMYLLFDLKYLQ